jgi:hypothetical protein
MFTGSTEEAEVQAVLEVVQDTPEMQEALNGYWAVADVFFSVK